jgi:hypothetical protein
MTIAPPSQLHARSQLPLQQGRMKAGLQRQNYLRQLAYLYIALLVLEGALRKWLLPGLAGPLLLVRDPIALAMLWLSWRQGLWRGQRWLVLWVWLAALMMITGLLALFSQSDQPLTILVYGLRTSLLHLPLVLLFPRILNQADVLRIGRTMLLIALPIALLMVWQYNSSADAWVNRTTFQGGSLLTAVQGKVRPPGPFSFISGAAEYFALLNALLLAGFVQRNLVPWLLGLGLAASLIAAGVSGSRLLIAYMQLVWLLGFVAILVIRPGSINSRTLITISFAALLAIAVLVVNPYRDTVEQAQETTQERIDQARGTDGGVVKRSGTLFQIPDAVWDKTPPFGYGLGMGTNFAATAMRGSSGFLLSENEWPRVIEESGAVTGSLFILFRMGLCLHVGRRALFYLRRGNVLPMALFAASFHLLLIGPITRPTTLGFAVVGMGLSLAAGRSSASAPATS